MIVDPSWLLERTCKTQWHIYDTRVSDFTADSQVHGTSLSVSLGLFFILCKDQMHVHSICKRSLKGINHSLSCGTRIYVHIFVSEIE